MRTEGPGAGELGDGHPVSGECARGPPVQAGTTLRATEVRRGRFCLLTLVSRWDLVVAAESQVLFAVFYGSGQL